MKGSFFSNIRSHNACTDLLFIIILAAVSVFNPLTASASGYEDNAQYRQPSYINTNTTNLVQGFISEKEIVLRELGMEISGRIPVITNMGYSELQKELNGLIDRIYTERVANAQELKAKNVEFDFYYKTDKDVYSIIIKSTVRSSFPKTRVDSVNFDITSGRMLTLNDILGVNGIPVINKYLTAEIKKPQSIYNTNFDGIKDSHDFYLEDGVTVLLFDEGEIAPVIHGLITFEIVVGRINNIVISYARDEYYIKPDYYDLKMMPLRRICENFNFYIKWTAELKRIDVLSEAMRTAMVIGENNYYRNTLRTEPLEAAPEIRNGVTYVPISFFDVVLGLVYSVDDDGNVTFSRYNNDHE